MPRRLVDGEADVGRRRFEDHAARHLEIQGAEVVSIDRLRHVDVAHRHQPFLQDHLLRHAVDGERHMVDRALAISGYSGRTSVQTEGFAPCVVPLLVDYEADWVIADSRRICCYLDAVSRDPVQLVPEDADARAVVMHQVDIVDRIPNGTLLFGFHPEADLRPEALRTAMESVYDYKIAALEAIIEANAGDAELVHAYRAKIVKEQGGKSVRLDAAFQRAARDHVAGLLMELDRALGISPPYLRGEAFSLGDVVWGVNLARLAYLGVASMWEDRLNVVRYANALFTRPTLRKDAVQATMDLMPPSRYFEAVAGITEGSPAQSGEGTALIRRGSFRCQAAAPPDPS